MLGAGFYNKKGNFWNFGINLHTNQDTAVSKDVYQALSSTANGSYNFEELSVGTTSYFDAYVGTAFPIGKHVTLGVRAKLLMGLTDLTYDIDGCRIVDGNLEEVTGIVHMWSPEIENTGNMSDEAKDVWGNMKSFGGAIDLGLEVSILNDHLKLSAAVTDLGFIRWSKSSGIVAAIEDEDIDPDNPNTWSGYTTRLTCKLNAGAEYNFCNKHFSIGLLSHTRFYRNGVASELTASFNIRPTNWMTLTASHTFLNGNKPGVFGAAINIHPCGINIFAGMDYVGTKYEGTDIYPFQLLSIDQEMMIPRNAKSMNLYVGVGFNLARPKHVRKTME